MKKSGMARKMVTYAVALLVLVVVLAWMSGAFYQKVPPGRVDASRRLASGMPTDEIHRVARIETVEVVGSLRAESRAEVAPRLMAAVVEMNVRAGDRVEKDQVLAKLDDRDVKAQYEQARQGVREAEAALENAKVEFGRAKKAYEQKAVSQQEYDRATAQYRIAQARIEQAREGESAAKTMLSYTTIKAPLGGIVIDRLADAGDMANPGKPLLVIYVPGTLRLEAPVPEALASSVRVGDRVDVKIDTLITTGGIAGTVQEIVPQAQVASRSVLVKVSLPDGLKGLVEGGAGRLYIPSGERVRLCVAESAVREVGQLRFIDVVKPAPDGAEVLERRQVQLGEARRFGRVELLSGADPGEKVALYGPVPPPLPSDAAALFSDMTGGR